MDMRSIVIDTPKHDMVIPLPALIEDLRKNSDWQVELRGDKIHIDRTPACVSQQLSAMLSGSIRDQCQAWSKRGGRSSGAVKRILVDFSSPNIAKDMHVGHLRSTIIGESICRLFEYMGHQVERINHIGDFGLQFGMLVQYFIECGLSIEGSETSIGDLQTYYAASKKRFDTDPEFKRLAYERVVQLQNKSDAQVVQIWEYFKRISFESYTEIYDKLDVHLRDLGESFYQPFIPEVIAELTAKGFITDDTTIPDKSIGCPFPPSSSDQCNGEPSISACRKIIRIEGHPAFKEQPLTVVKSDGGYTYDTTDLAALWYRLKHMQMDHVYYVVDNGQRSHFDMIFAVAERAGWFAGGRKAEHIGFGVVLSENGKKFKSRDGDTVKLNDLLQEAVTNAERIVTGKDKNRIQEENRARTIQNIAYGAIKYADLSTCRTNDYRFSFNKMLQLKGNTAPYLMYAYTRICSIMRKAGILMSPNNEFTHDGKILEFQYMRTTCIDPEEIALAKHLLLIPDIMDEVSQDLLLHKLAGYVYKLSTVFNAFFERCVCCEYEGGVLKNIHWSRMAMVELTRRVMHDVLTILGLPIVEAM